MLTWGRHKYRTRDGATLIADGVREAQGKRGVYLVAAVKLGDRFGFTLAHRVGEIAEFLAVERDVAPETEAKRAAIQRLYGLAQAHNDGAGAQGEADGQPQHQAQPAVQDKPAPQA